MGSDVKRLAILGSTGSIGQQTLGIVRNFPDKFQVVGLAGGKNIDLLTQQVAEFRPKLVYSPLKAKLPGMEKQLTMEEMVSCPEIDLAVIATSGKAGLYPTLAALKADKNIALANKEVLVMAGEVVIHEAERHQVQIFPIDSEHSAIWQCLQGEEAKINRLFLTASGGPFHHYTQSQLMGVTVEETLRHPIWKMGKKVTVDSATLVNKGLEVIEAHWLFTTPFESIEVLIHPQSIIHSLVEFIDGSLKAQLGFPDMRLPIQYALSYPERLPNPELPHLNLLQIGALEFEPVDYDKFPCFKLALDAGKAGGTYPAVLCAADEVAVKLFLEHRINFVDIAGVIEETLSRHQGIINPSLDEILAADAWARETAFHVACELD